MKQRYNRRAQAETGPIQNVVIALVLVIGVSIGMFNFLSQGLIANYDTPVLSDESSFTAYQEQQENLTTSIVEVKDTLTNPASGFLDIADALITGGFSVLRDFVGTPIVVADAMISTAGESLGVSNELVGLAFYGIIIIIIFAILALIMKVRA